MPASLVVVAFKPDPSSRVIAPECAGDAGWAQAAATKDAKARTMSRTACEG
ncbi:MAG: hypothetical protein IRZ16_03355 [Myxococcaceae bacterium]|nr:hypothetical protein [Myxococcaceae bacterium]